MNTLQKLWARSPQQVYASLRGKVNQHTPNPRWIQVTGGPSKGASMYLDPDSFVGWKMMLEGSFDSFIYEKLATFGSIQGKTCWDIGSHFGYHTLGFASLVGETGHVYAFEPNPHNILRLKKNVDKNEKLKSRIKVMEYALSNSVGKLEFSFSKDVDDSRSSGSHLTSVDTPLGSEYYTTFDNALVNATTIDLLIDRGEITPANILKIDVEGAEKLVLEGGTKFFRAHRPIVFMEVHNILMMHHCMTYFHELNYRITVLDGMEATLSKCFICAEPQ